MAQNATATWMRGNETGASSVEYAILVALIAVVIVGAVGLFGGNLNNLFQTSCDSIATTNAGSC